MFMPGPMVAYNPGKLRFVPTGIAPSGVTTGYIDQGALMYHPSPEASN